MVNEIKGLKIGEASVHRGKGLLPCHCGSQDVAYVSYGGGWFVKCLCCECMVAKQISVVTETILPFKTQEDAAKVWNKRSDAAPDLRKLAVKASPTDIVKIREKRAFVIAEAIRKAGGDVISKREIAADTGLSKAVVGNNILYVKRKYPNVKSAGKTGYFWEENSNE